MQFCSYFYCNGLEIEIFKAHFVQEILYFLVLRNILKIKITQPYIRKVKFLG